MVVVVLQGLTSCGKFMDPENLRAWDTRQTMSPLHFTYFVSQAYRAAREIPEILDSLYCYCECKKNHGHKSLLTCYMDRHAVRCDACLGEALMAYEMHKKGKDAVAIRKAVDKEFSRR